VNGPVPAPDDRLSAYLDGELRPDEREAVEGFVAASPEWRAELDDVSWARDTLRRLPAHEAPPGFWEAALSPELALARGRRRRVPRMAGLGAAAAAVAAIVTAAFVVPSPDRVTPKVPAVADSHAVRASVTDDPVTQLAGVSLIAPYRR
jgi:anti-sigma factor RsiW